MKADKVIDRYAGRSDIRLIVRSLPDESETEGEGASVVLIEGSQASLRFLAELLLAVADDPQDDGFSISPTGPGSVYFNRQQSELGLYLYRTGTHQGPRPTET